MKFKTDVKIYTYAFESVIGQIHLASNENELVAIMLPDITNNRFLELLSKEFPEASIFKDRSKNREAEKQLKEYFEGKRTEFTLRLNHSGTDFEKKVLNKVVSIPYGKTKTYGEIANQIGHPKASRAVGMANAKNRLPIVIPCHRVVASNGIGGYAGGLKLKEKLLILEYNNLAKMR